MTDDGDRQADLDWLYGRSSSGNSSSPSDNGDSTPAADDSGRPRVSPPSYDVSEFNAKVEADEYVHRPEPVAAPPRHQTGSGQPGRSPGGRHQGSRADRAARPPRPPKVRRRHRFRLGRTILVLLIAFVVWLVAVPVHALNKMGSIEESTAEMAVQKGTAVLLVGSDSREGVDGARADTMLILYRPPTGQSVLISLPRDSYVTIPGYGEDKLNAAYSYGGDALLEDTVEQATGVQLDGYLEIGFDGFTDLVDAVGGIEVCVDEAVQDDFSGLDLPAGCSDIDGTMALAYVRMRYADPEGDIGRAKRQREVIGKVVKKAATPATILNPVRYWNTTMAVSDMLAKGDQTGIGDLAGAGLALMSVSGDSGLSLVVPIASTEGWTDDGASVVMWDDAAASEMFAQIAAGNTDGLERFAS